MIKTTLQDGRGTANTVKVSQYGQLVTAPIAYSEPYTASLNSTGTAFKIADPIVGKRFVVTDILLDAGKNVSASTAGTIVLYEADNEADTTEAKIILSVEMLKNTSREITGLNLLVTEGVWLNLKTTDATVEATVLGYYIDIPKELILSSGGAEVNAVVASTLNDNLKGYWQLDESSGTRVDDFSFYDLTGVVGSPANRTGKVDSAMDFDGTDGIYGAVVNGDFDGTGDWTLAMWVIFDTSGQEYIADVWGGSGRTWVLEKEVTDKLLFRTNPTGSGSGVATSFTGMTAFNTAQWYHIAITYDSSGTSTEIFVDGTSIGTHSGEMMSNSTYVFAIGSYGTSASLDGGIDSMAYWDRILTDAEVLELAGVTTDQPW